jgi:hypothetical protein
LSIQERFMRLANEKLSRALVPPVVGAVCVLGLVTTVNVVSKLTHHLGDIVAFTASKRIPAGESTRLLVHRQNQYGCVLDLNTLRRSGGSLIVENQLGTGRTFRVHWAGPHSSAGTADCGAQADLIVEKHDLDILALAAGGYGVGRHHTPFSTADLHD